MNKSGRCAFRALVAAFGVASACVSPVVAHAAQGLVVGSGDWLWPQLQARITVQTATLSRVGLTTPSESTGPAARGVQGGAVLGDYVFAAPAFGSFRATSGLMLGNPGGAPLLSTSPSARLNVTLLDMGPTIANGQTDGPATVPYLGLGYSSPALWRSLWLSADVGLVAGRPSGLTGLGRAMLGTQGLDAAVRDLRLAPVLQLGLQYSF